jgi:hypothetical protein
MSANNVRNSNDNIGIISQCLRRQSMLFSSNPTSDVLPIDYILVYDCTDHNNSDNENNNHQHIKKCEQSSEHRRRFEEYLCKKQGLILNHVVSRMNN